MKKLSYVLLTFVVSVLFSSIVFADTLATLDTDKGIVNIVGYTTTQDDGEDVFVALLEYTNLSDESTAPWGTFNVNAYQNGIELEKAYMYNYEYEDFKDNSTKVRPDSALKYYEAFKMSDNSPVDVEVSELFSWNGNHAEYTFDMGGNNETDITSSDTVNTNDTDKDWEAEYNKLLKKYKKLKKKYNKLKKKTGAE